ncbi:MAG: choice-of-anchor D domain-containing protein [Candidatus Marinimicrobia bacterium]|nr:choice-of-anchor D domain-containing protein [Candidatus Neomarinimicrobiota bacterium]
MKKILIFLLLFGTSLLAQNIMIINDASGGANDTVAISVEIQNTEPFVGFQFDLSLDDQISFIEGSERLSDRASDHQITATVVDENILRVFAYSMAMAEFSDNSGEVCSFKLKLGTIPGLYSLTVENGVIGDSQSLNILTNITNGTVTIEAPDIDISPISLDYDRVPLLQTSEKSFNIYNTGNHALSVSRIYTSFSDFEVIGDTNFTVNAGDSRVVTIRFHSNVKGIYNKQVKILCDDPDEPVKLVNLSVIAYAVNELDINDMFGRSGHSSVMTIDISNMEEFVGFSFDLNVPEVMTYVPNSIALTDRKTDHVVSATTLDNGYIRVVAYSVSNTLFSGNNGNVVALDFLIDGQGGFYNINFIEPVIGDINSANMISDHYNGTLEIAAPDIYMNPTSLNYGSVSIFDTLTLQCTMSNQGSDTLKVNNIIFYDSHFFSSQELPVDLPPGQQTLIPVSFHSDAEGTFNSNIRIRSNDPDEDPTDIQLSATAYIPNIMRVDSTSIVSNDTGWISISIENYEPFVGFQFDLNIPDGLIYNNEVRATERLSDHVLNAHMQDDNTLTVFAYSTSQAEISSSSGPVVFIKFKADSSHESYFLNLDNVIIANSNAENIVSSYEGKTVTVIRNVTIELNSGWNLVSWNVDTQNDSINVLFSDIMNNVVVILGFENAGLTYDPDLPQFCTLKLCDHLHGYWLKMKTSTLFPITGLFIKNNTPIELETGWNLVSYLPNNSMDVEHALGSIMDKVIVVLGFDEGGLTYDPDLPQFSTLKTLSPGFGYWIKVIEPCTLVYPDN